MITKYILIFSWFRRRKYFIFLVQIYPWKVYFTEKLQFLHHMFKNKENKLQNIQNSQALHWNLSQQVSQLQTPFELLFHTDAHKERERETKTERTPQNILNYMPFFLLVRSNWII